MQPAAQTEPEPTTTDWRPYAALAGAAAVILALTGLEWWAERDRDRQGKTSRMPYQVYHGRTVR